MALATPLLPFLPLAAKQILLNNFLSDVPSIATSGDSVDPERVSRPQRWRTKEIRRFMVVFGVISSVFDLMTFALLLRVFRADQATFQTVWFVASLLTELAVVLVLRTHRPAFRSRPSRLLSWTTVAVAAATLAIPYLGPVSSMFGFVPLSALQMETVIAIVAGSDRSRKGLVLWAQVNANQGCTGFPVSTAIAPSWVVIRWRFRGTGFAWWAVSACAPAADGLDGVVLLTER